MKIKRKKAFLILTIGISLTASGVLAQARLGQRRGPAFQRGGQAGILMILKAKQEELKVTDEQLEKIKDLMITQQEKALEHRHTQDKLRLELGKMMMDRENLDYSQIKQVLTKLSDSRNEMFIERLRDRDAFHSVLTPEQQEALKSLRAERLKARRGFSRGRFPAKRGPIRNPDARSDVRRNRFRRDADNFQNWF